MDNRKAHREEGITFGTLARVLRHRRRMILGITAVSAAIAVLVSLLLPVYYRAETNIYPPQDKGSNLAAQLMGQAGALLALAGGAAGIKTPGELYVAMLKSRTVLDGIIGRFDLKKLYKLEYTEDARRRLLRLITVRTDRKSGVIFLSVEDRDPKRAADMANAFVEELRSLTGGLAISEAGKRRMFFEEQIRHAKESLARAEEDLKEFQLRTGMIQVDSQARAVLEGIARLRAEIAAKEVEARVLRSFSTPQNPDLQRVEEQVRALRAELGKVESGKEKGFNPLMSSERIPEMGTEYLRKLRQLKYNEVLYELLVKQFELAKLDEGRDAVVIQVIDPAVPPERKSRPQRSLIVLMVTMTMLLVSVVLAWLLENPVKKPEEPPMGR